MALARSGFDVTGADLSQAMVARAHANAAEAGYMARILDENRIEDAQLTERRGVRP